MWAEKLFLYINSVKGWLCSGPLWHYIMIVFCDDEGRCLLCEAKPVLFDTRISGPDGPLILVTTMFTLLTYWGLTAALTNFAIINIDSDLNFFINHFYDSLVWKRLKLNTWDIPLQCSLSSLQLMRNWFFNRKVNVWAQTQTMTTSEPRNSIIILDAWSFGHGAFLVLSRNDTPWPST